MYPNIWIEYEICENFDSIGYQSCKRIMKEKKYPCCNLCGFRRLNMGLDLKSSNIWVRSDLFLKNYVTSERAVSHNVYKTINKPPLLVTKYVVTPTTVLTSVQQPISRYARINPNSSLGRVTRPNLRWVQCVLRNWYGTEPVVSPKINPKLIRQCL